MKATILLNHSENTRKVEEEEKTRFLRSILEEVGIPISEFWQETEDFLSIEQKMRLRNILQTYNIQVLEEGKSSTIFLRDEGSGEWTKIAEWFPPSYKLKKDLSHPDPRKRLFLEMNVEFWSLFEEENPNHMETD